MARERPTRQLLAAIGEVCLDSARLEGELRETLSILTDSSWPFVIFAGEDLSRLILATARVSKYTSLKADDKVWEELDAILKAADSGRVLRNKVVHSVWWPTSTPKSYVAIRGLRNSRTDYSQDTLWRLEDVPAVSTKLREVSQSLQAWRSRHFPDHYMEVPWARDVRLFPDGIFTVTEDDQPAE